ncbi:ACT domain-containing protein [Sulfitobacter sp.]|uniref:ACT domain-containing protein n=1 Tax=Sulfitobacter sp. TaxID=1903071 RepID=UPI0030034319
MTVESNLDELIKSLSAVLVDGLYVFVTLQSYQTLAGIEPRMMFKEAEGTTYILLKSEAEKHGLAYEFPCRMITLNIHSSLEAVGFMARIATELAKHDMGVNPVSGFFHDHLFVPDGREHDAMNVLEELSKR